MARSRKSRKGKKEWRRNISTADHDKFLEEKGRDERSGGALDAVPSENIFFVDKSKVAPKLRKVDKWRARESHADAILKRSSLVPPLVPEPSPARVKSSVKPSEKLADKPSDKPANASADKPADSAGVALAPAEIGGGGGGGAEESGDGGGGEIVAAASGEGAMAIVQSAGTSSGGKEIVAADSGVAGGKRRAKKARKNSQKPLFDLWADEDLAGNRRGVRATDKATPGGGGEVEERVRRRGDGKMIGGKEERNKPGSAIPAVEIDAPGCSFNPSIEEHQDAIAVAVAEELKESYQAALAPTPPQLMVSRAEEEEARMQEAADFFLTQGEEDEEEEEEEEEDEDGNTAAVTKHRVSKLCFESTQNTVPFLALSSLFPQPDTECPSA
ncbi:unnamed protein product [Closterium sp. NIES-64]|nr:unnamed protein product [Closterium sp. NIES-64]